MVTPRCSHLFHIPSRPMTATALLAVTQQQAVDLGQETEVRTDQNKVLSERHWACFQRVIERATKQLEIRCQSMWMRHLGSASPSWLHLQDKAWRSREVQSPSRRKIVPRLPPVHGRLLVKAPLDKSCAMRNVHRLQQAYRGPLQAFGFARRCVLNLVFPVF